MIVTAAGVGRAGQGGEGQGRGGRGRAGQGRGGRSWEFDAVMLTIDTGKISPVFSSQFGWHILEVEETRQQDISQNLRVVQAKNALHKRKFEEELDLWLQKIRQEAYVDIKEPTEK